MITELSLYQEVHLAQQGGLTPFGSDDQTQAGPQEEGASCWGASVGVSCINLPYCCSSLEDCSQSYCNKLTYGTP